MSKKRIDSDALLAQHNIIDIIGKHVHLTKRGSEHYGKCPFHDDGKASLQVNERKQIYSCFPCGFSGDAIDFLQKLGYTFHEACKEIGGEQVFATGAKQTNAPAKPKPLSWSPVVPAPRPATDIVHYRHGRPSRSWAYHTADGSIAGYVCRFDTADGKEVLPYTYATDGKRSEWRWMGMEAPRPLYNLHLLHQRPDATVIVVEGEKTAEAAADLIDTAVVVTWVGGARGIHKTDWTPLHGRKVLLWPDNDYTHAYGEKHAKAGQIKPFHEQPGNEAMLAIAGILGDTPKLLKWIRNPEGMPCGWDIADADWDSEATKAYVRTSVIPVPTPQDEPEGLITFSPEIQELPPAPPENNYEPPGNPPFPPGDDESDYIGHSDYFSILGWDKTEGQQGFYFFQKQAKTTLRYGSSGLSKAALITLAPLRFWETAFPKSKGGIDMDAAQEFLIRSSVQAGPFNERYVRGRGAWVDGTRVVIHTGRKLIVDSEPMELGTIQSKFIYETSDDLGIITESPLGTKEANRLMDITKLMNWERDVNAYLLAGWCVIAPVCGALNWRPHIWLTGSAGTGKSWVFQFVVRRLLGETALAVQGETSEAGLRQTLGHDALPVVFDEADIDDKRSAERVQNILTLMRSASADNGGLLLKGSATGQAKSYSIRSCFAFASIGVQVANMADRSRVTLIGMREVLDENIKKARWEKLQALHNQVMTDEFVQRFQARTVRLLPVILKNARTFSNAAAAYLGQQRTGDQLGAILAGAYSLHSDSEISYEAALKWVSEKDWSEERSLQGNKDEIALLAFIMDTQVKVDAYDAGRTFERTIGELINTANGKTSLGVSEWDAETKLNRCGVKVKDGFVYISNSHKFILGLLKDSAWSKNHAKILRRLPGAVEKDSLRFGVGVTTRAVGIPLSVLSE